MKNFRAADKFNAGGDEKHDINFHWPYEWVGFYVNLSTLSHDNLTINVQSNYHSTAFNCIINTKVKIRLTID